MDRLTGSTEGRGRYGVWARRLVVALLRGGVAVLASARPALAGGSGGIADDLAHAMESAGRIWAPALLVLGALVVGGKILMGSQHVGESVRNYLLGAIFLVLAAAGGAAIIARLGGLGIN